LPLLLVVLDFDVAELVPERAQALDLWRQLLLLLLDFGINSLNQRGQVLHRLLLNVVSLLLILRHQLNVVFNFGVASDALLLLNLVQHIQSMRILLRQNLLSPVQHRHLTLNLIERLLHHFELVVLHTQISRILPEIVLLNILLTLLTRVLLLPIS